MIVINVIVIVVVLFDFLTICGIVYKMDAVIEALHMQKMINDGILDRLDELEKNKSKNKK